MGTYRTPETIPEQTTPEPSVPEQNTTKQPVPDPPVPERPPEKTYTFEEVRAALADKARAGFKNEIKDILTAHGAAKLSEITDPVVLAQVFREAQEVG